MTALAHDRRQEPDAPIKDLSASECCCICDLLRSDLFHFESGYVGKATALYPETVIDGLLNRQLVKRHRPLGDLARVQITADGIWYYRTIMRRRAAR